MYMLLLLAKLSKVVAVIGEIRCPFAVQWSVQLLRWLAGWLAGCTLRWVLGSEKGLAKGAPGHFHGLTHACGHCVDFN